MEQKPQSRHVFDNPRNVRRVIYALLAACVVVLGGDFFVYRHIDHPWESIFGFYAIYGFVACVLLVLVAKELRRIIMRREDYYDR